MAMTPEKKVKANIVRQLKAMGAYYFFPATGGYGRGGIPDIIVCYKGKFFGIECKAGNNTPTSLQKLEIAKIKHAGGSAWVMNEKNCHKAREMLVLGTLNVD